MVIFIAITNIIKLKLINLII